MLRELSESWNETKGKEDHLIDSLQLKSAWQTGQLNEKELRRWHRVVYQTGPFSLSQYGMLCLDIYGLVSSASMKRLT